MQERLDNTASKTELGAITIAIEKLTDEVHDTRGYAKEIDSVASGVSILEKRVTVLEKRVDAVV